MKWIDQLLPIIEEYKDGGEPLDSDEVDSLCSIIRAKINLQEGNITDAEYERILDGEYPKALLRLDPEEDKENR